MRVAVLTGKFPQPSQAFILAQITGLLDAGVDLEIFASRPDTGTPIHEAFQHYGLAERTFYRGAIPAAGLGRWRALMGELEGLGSKQVADVAGTLLRAGDQPPLPSPLPGFYVAGVLERPKFDLVHAQFGVYGRYAAELKRLGHCKRLVATFHGFDANVVPAEKGEDVYDGLFASGDAFTVNSNFLKGRLIDLGCPEERIHILPMGVDLSRFTPGEPREDGRVELVTVARLVEAKGLDHAIRAVAELKSRGVEIHYRVAGGGELEASLNELISQLDLEDEVELLGPKTHEEIAELYATSDLFVLPSVRTKRGDEETQGVVVQEAQASGLPVVVTDIGGIPEGLVHAETGLVCESGSPAALVDALEKMIERRDEWPEMGRAGRRFVASGYDLDKLNERLHQLYLDVTSGR